LPMSKAKDLASGGSGKNQRRRRWLRRVWLCGPWKWRGKGEASRWRLRRLGKNAGAEAVMASRRRLGHGRWWLRGDHARSANPSGLAGVWFGLSPSSRGGEKATGGEGRGDGRADGRPMLFFPSLLENRSSYMERKKVFPTRPVRPGPCITSRDFQTVTPSWARGFVPLLHAWVRSPRDRDSRSNPTRKMNHLSGLFLLIFC